MLRNNLKVAVRNLTRNKIYSLINIVGLGVGIACVVLIMLWVKYELSYDKFHENADRLYRVVFTTEQINYHGFYQPGPLANYLKENFPGIEQSTNYSEMEWKLSHGTKGFFCKGSFVDTAFFKMFSFPVEEGNPETVLINPGSVVISKSLAQKIFGQNDPVGKTLKLNDDSDLIVTGVFPDVPETSHMQFDFVIPFSDAPDWMNMWDRKCVQTYVLLKENISFDDVNKNIYGVMNKHNPEWENVLYLYPITKSHLYEPGGTGRIVYIYIFSVLGILILLVACINFMNLSTARSEKRMKEIGIKKTVGSSRWELVKQFMSESIMFSFIALFISIILVELSLPYVNNILNTQITLNYSVGMITILLSITLLTGLVAGSYPALYLSSFRPIVILKGKTLKTTGDRSSIFRKTMVIVQFAFSVFIITCVLFINNQLHFIQSKNLGFNKEQVLVISTRGALQHNVSTIKNELLKHPAVQSVTASATNLTSFAGAGTGPIEWEGKDPEKLLEVGFNFVDKDFIKTLQIKMVQGRFFSKEFSTDMSEAFVVNEATVKAMGIDNPINKNLTAWFGRKGKIVGVISDFNTMSLHNEMTPVVFIPAQAANYLCVRIKSDDISGTIKSIGTIIKKIVPDDPFEYQFLDEKINTLYKTEQVTGELATFIAILAIFISCLGLLGLASFSSQQRTKEIGIRKVLGSSVIGILIMLVMDFVKWILLANIIAVPIAWYAMNKWLQNFVYRIDISWWVFLLAGGIALVIALATVSFQAIKAAIANPVESLRYE
ncbi:MAG: ABC transporter permease [Ignavibacteria bacterium]|jgi:putative ABC transport system permease protein